MRSNSDHAPRSVSGLALARGFYHDLVAPIVHDVAPKLHYSAALIGPGSEVLGYDDETSTDHHWGPRVLIFCGEVDAAKHGPELSRELGNRLPCHYGGYPTNFTTPDPTDAGVQLLQTIEEGPVNHRVEIVALRNWVTSYLATSVEAASMDAIDWLTLPQQKLLSLVTGEVFRDDGNRLSELRERLQWYPEDVWRYLLASTWRRIGQEEHLVGRAGQSGDELGARIIAARLARDVMRLCFLAERRYAPYSKWLGRAFRDLSASPTIEPLLNEVCRSNGWRDRDAALIPVWEALAGVHNSLGLTGRMPEQARQFFGRPFHVVAIHGFADAILETIDADWLTPTMRRSPIGGVDLISDNTDLLEDHAYRRGIRELITSGAGG